MEGKPDHIVVAALLLRYLRPPVLAAWIAFIFGVNPITVLKGFFFH
jgi:hypothetical protein